MIGQIGTFDIKTGNWLAYVERMEMYFVANKVEEAVKLPTLISVMGEEAYELLTTLASPKKPSSLSLQEAVNLLGAHLQPKPSFLAERYRFRQRRQLQNETIAEYVAELKKMARYCDFGSTLEDNLRDQFVCGVKSESTRQKLFAKEELSYKKAVSMATSFEAAAIDAGAVQSVMEEVHKLHIANCEVCGYIHTFGECRYKNYECSLCKKKGHLRRVCPEIVGRRPREYSGRNDDGGRAARGRRGRGGRGRGWRPAYARGAASGTHWVQQDTYESAGAAAEEAGCGSATGSAGSAAGKAAAGCGTAIQDAGAGPSGLCAHYWDRAHYGHQEEDDEEPVFQMSLAKYKPVCISVLVGDVILNMEIDTGSALSCISRETFMKFYPSQYLHPCQIKLKFYDGSMIVPLGYVKVIVYYKGRSKELDLYVIDKGCTNLLGRQWLAELSIEVPTCKIYDVNNSQVPVKYVNDKSDTSGDCITSILSRHRGVFDGTLGRYNGGTVALSVREGAQPIFCRSRPLPFAMRARVDAELDAMLHAGVIEPVDHSDWATPLVIAHKADGGIRLCADYKVTLNRVLMVDRYPVPRIDELFSELSGNRYFTKIDLSQAYNQLELDEDSRAYTVINTHRGLFKYNRLVYGLSSSPGIFQKFMTNLFRNMQDVVIFFDDILIKSKDVHSHLQKIESVFTILETRGLKIKKSKCSFLAREIKFLGYVINEDGVKVDPDKVKAMVDMAYPKNVSELKSFLGMVNFYGKFVKNISTHLAPLYELLKKGKHFCWSNKSSEAFNKVKRLLCSAEVLVHFDMTQESVVTCDAGPLGVGAVLSARAPDGTERVVAYASRALTPAERHYSQIHKEALAIIFATEKFHQYIYGRKFTLRTDHKPLVSIFGPNSGIPVTAASRLQRWAIKLAAYDFKIEYIRTDHNTADALSRLIKAHREIGEDVLPEQTYLHFATDALLLDYSTIKKETSTDPILARVLSYIKDGWPQDTDIRELKPYLNRKQELYTELGCILWGHRVIIPHTCRNKVLTELHDSHMGIVKTKSLARSYVWWPGLDENIESVCSGCGICAAVANAPAAHAPQAWPWPSRAWSRLHIDFLGPFCGHTYLIVVDAGSKWIEAIMMRNTNAGSVTRALRDMFARFGLPKQIVSDNGPPFTSSEFDIFLKRNKIDHLFSAPYHPASNGAAENAVKICKRVLKKAYAQKLDPEIALSRFLLTYRNTEHYTTGESPAKLLLGRSLRMRLDALKPSRESRVEERQQYSEQHAGGARRQLQTGDQVWFRDYRSRDKWLPGTITDRLGTTDYKVRAILGNVVQRHIDQLKSRSDPNEVNPSSLPCGPWGRPCGPRGRPRRSLSLPRLQEAGECSGVVSMTPATAATVTSTGTLSDAAAAVSPLPVTGVPTRIGSSEGPTGQRTKRERCPPRRYGFEDIY